MSQFDGEHGKHRAERQTHDAEHRAWRSSCARERAPIARLESVMARHGHEAATPAGYSSLHRRVRSIVEQSEAIE